MKCTFDPSYYIATESNKTIAALNIVGSIIINVNLTPRDGYYTGKTAKSRAITEDEELRMKMKSLYVVASDERSDRTTILSITHHNPSTFFLQTTYFIIKFLEYLGVVLLTICYYPIWGDEPFLLFHTKIGLTLGLGSLVSWVSHLIYYRLHGHPWHSANGPTINLSTHVKKNSFKCDIHSFGERSQIEIGQHK